MVSKLQFSDSHSVLAHNDDGLSINIHMYACLAKLSLILHKQCLMRIRERRRSKISFSPPYIYLILKRRYFISIRKNRYEICTLNTNMDYTVRNVSEMFRMYFFSRRTADIERGMKKRR